MREHSERESLISWNYNNGCWCGIRRDNTCTRYGLPNTLLLFFERANKTNCYAFRFSLYRFSYKFNHFTFVYRSLCKKDINVIIVKYFGSRFVFRSSWNVMSFMQLTCFIGMESLVLSDNSECTFAIFISTKICETFWTEF